MADRRNGIRRSRSRRYPSKRGRRKGPRSQADIDKERQALWDQTAREIDAIAAEFHAKLPRAEAEATGAVYARYSTRLQDSVADQVRGILEDALRMKIFVPREMIFFDLAVWEAATSLGWTEVECEVRNDLEAQGVGAIVCRNVTFLVSYLQFHGGSLS
ncbi:MAG: hypothetical protein IT426_20270 [Pirellulales bacterium]|nr:hypothetical protein [Pirellulales bacterium]